MGKHFSTEVETALRYIYYDMCSQRGAEGFELLRKASDAGDGDASCIMARCLWGEHYVWEMHNFPDDEELGDKYLKKSVEQGSAIGIMVALRTNQYTEDMLQKTPYANLNEVVARVQEMADDGDAFCQYTMGNYYFWFDFLVVDKEKLNAFPSRAESALYISGQIRKCEELFMKAMYGGLYLAINNLSSYYINGREGYVLPQPEKAKYLFKMGAELGFPNIQWLYAQELEDSGKRKEGFEWRKKAAEGGQAELWYDVAEQYRTGNFLPKDINKAVECYEKCLNQRENNYSKIESANCLGYMFCEGSEVPRDFARALPLMKFAVDNGHPEQLYYLGKCYYGTGEYEMARNCFENCRVWDMEVNYMWGMMYVNGLGVAEDIGKGIKLLKQARGIPEAKAEIAKYQKPLFGSWTRKE